MKLHRSAWYTCAGSYYIGSDLVNEQQYGRDEGRQPFGQFGSALRGYIAWAGRIQYKTHRVGPGGHSGIYVLLAGQAANLDTGTCLEWCHGSQS